jgi:alanine racemase
MSRPLHAQINLTAFRSNLAFARARAAKSQVLAVVKANAYGHGITRVLPALADADGLALVELDAAVDLRLRHYTRRILLLEGFFAVTELPEIAARRIAVVIHNVEQVRMLETAKLERPLEVFLKVNTGMNRLGIRPEEVHGVIERLTHCDTVATVRLMTHLARADEPGGIKDQLAIFNAACEGLPYPRSIANSAGVIRYDEVGGDIVRPGIMLYGATPFADRSAQTIGIEPVMTLRSEIVAVQHLKAGESIGYGGTYTAGGPQRIGVVACGYADGYPRHAPNGTPVLVCGRRTHTAGRVSMDMLTVEITHLPEATVGSAVVLWGEGLPVDEVAQAAGTVGYELLCAIAPRVPFVVSQFGKLDLEL